MLAVGIAIRRVARVIVAALAFVLAAASPCLADDGAKLLSVADVIERAEPSCVRLDVKLRDGKSIGSGFIVHESGWVVTNYHVVAGAIKATAGFSDGTSADVEGFLAYGLQRDIAVLKLDSKRKFKPLTLAREMPRKGEATVAIGAPQGLSFTATEGILSAIRDGKELKAFGQDSTGKWLQTSTPISPGSSGGPLLNLRGEVVGANSGSIATAQNVNFAISAEDIADIVKVAAKSELRSLAKLEPLPESSPTRRRPPSPSSRGSKDAPEEIVCKLPAKRRFTHRFKITEEEDEFDKVKWLRTEWLPLSHNDRRLTSCGLRISAPATKDAPPPAVMLEIGTTSQSFAFLTNRRLQILVDDESHDFGTLKHKGDVGRAGVSETMSVLVRLDGFLEISMAGKVKVRLGTLEFELTSMQQECLRDLASRLPEGTTTVGDIRVERHELKDDPSASKSKKSAPAAKKKSTKEGTAEKK